MDIEPAIVSRREAAARRAIDATMATVIPGCIGLPAAPSENGPIDVWTDGDAPGLEVHPLEEGSAQRIAIDVATGQEIGRGEGLSGVAPSIIDFYLERPLRVIRRTLKDVED